jgi:hypothetical protein
MSYLNANVPSDNEAVALGASRIRALSAALNVLISQIFQDSGAFLTSWLNGAQILTGTVPGTALVNNSVGAAQMANDSVGLAQLAPQATGSLLSFDGSENPVLIAPGTNGQVLMSDGSVAAWADLPPPAHGVFNFLGAPVTLATGSGAVAWTTLTGLESYGIPTTATALILAAKLSVINSGLGTVSVRPNSSGAVNLLAAGSGSSVYSNTSYNQAAYPLNVTGSSVTVDYEVVNNSTSWTIYLVGYVS